MHISVCECDRLCVCMVTNPPSTIPRPLATPRKCPTAFTTTSDQLSTAPHPLPQPKKCKEVCVHVTDCVIAWYVSATLTNYESGHRHCNSWYSSSCNMASCTIFPLGVNYLHHTSCMIASFLCACQFIAPYLMYDCFIFPWVSVHLSAVSSSIHDFFSWWNT